MVMLTVMSDREPTDIGLRTSDFGTAADRLAEAGVRLRSWELVPGSIAERSTDDVLAAYAAPIDAICRVESFTLVDCIRMYPEDTDEWRTKATAARATFRSEHRHAEDEVRFFAGGIGCFYLHLAPRVLAVICEAGELLSVPAGTTHWFDMGPNPTLCAVRFFEREDGWIGDFTGDPIAERFPDLPQLLAAFGK